MSLAHPWLLAALAALPALWWLLRVTPPAPRRQRFPAIALLAGLAAPARTATHTPWWLLALRLAVAALIILGLADPSRTPPPGATVAGPAVLVIDNGWAAAADWAARIHAAGAALQRLSGPSVRLLPTAPDADGAPPQLGPSMAAADLAGRLAALRPMPWPPDRAAAAAALATLPAATYALYIADGLAVPGDPAFAAALRRLAGVTELRADAAPGLLHAPTLAQDGTLGLRATAAGAGQIAGQIAVRALDAAGTILTETALDRTADGTATGTLLLPPPVRDRVASLRIAGQDDAGGVVLLDGPPHLHPVGLLTAAGAEDQALTGTLYYIRRALASASPLRDGRVGAILAHPASVIIAADPLIADPDERAALLDWVRHGGMLIRFAGPAMAAAAPTPDPLLPVDLLPGDRALGGAMSWSRPAPLAAFPATSPFAGLPVPAEIRVSRQVLATPADGQSVWATLADGTPLVTAASLGAGRLVLFHVTANADWSDLPLSGLFVDMLHRLADLSAGVRPQDGAAPLAPLRLLDGFGTLVGPSAAARPLDAAALLHTPASPAHPPGLYGPAEAVRAFNLSATLPSPRPAAPIAGAIRQDLSQAVATRSYGPALLAAALILFAADALVALGLRGLLATACVLLTLGPARGQPAPAPDAPGSPSLATHLAYVVTGDAQADGISRAGLQGLSDYVNARTAAALELPMAVDPARDDLSFYPLLYWPILADAPAPDGAAIARLDDYMQDGGIILFDTRDADAPDAGARAALRRIGSRLAIPPLAPLTGAHVLSHSFYLLHDWPGRYADAPVWVDGRPDRANDGVSPVVIGGDDWAAAWATDATGDTPYDVTGGAPQRQQAYRFGVNLVMYALTGNYKQDQLHVPELLRRMGGDPDPPPGAASPDIGAPP